MFKLSIEPDLADAGGDAVGDHGDGRCSGGRCRPATGGSGWRWRGSIRSFRSTSPESSYCSFSIARSESRREFEMVNRDHMLDAIKGAINAYGWFYPAVEFLSMLALASLLSYGGFQSAGRRPDAGRHGGVLPVRHANLPADPGLEREIQHSANGDGGELSGSSGCWTSRCGWWRRHKPKPVSGTPGGDRIRPCVVCVQRRGLGVAGRQLPHCSPARRSRRWATPARARRRSPTCYCGSTTCRQGRFGSAAWTCASSTRCELRRHFGVVLQDPHLFTGTIGGNIRLGTERITEEAIEKRPPDR